MRMENSVCESLAVFDAVYLHVNLEREDVAGLFLCRVSPTVIWSCGLKPGVCVCRLEDAGTLTHLCSPSV